MAAKEAAPLDGSIRGHGPLLRGMLVSEPHSLFLRIQ